jgi:hypothetical protein
VAAEAQRQQAPWLVFLALRQVLPQPNSQSWPTALPLEPHSHRDSHSVQANRPGQEQAQSSCIHPIRVSLKELSLLQKQCIFRA